MSRQDIKPDLDPNILPTAWKTACAMEDPLTIISDLANALALIAETIDETGTASTVQRLAWMIREQTNEAEELRGQLFHMTHASNRRLLTLTREEGDYPKTAGGSS